MLFLQAASSILEVVSIGLIIPFLSTLTNFDSFVTNKYASYALNVLNIHERNDIIILTSIVFASAFCCSNLLKLTVLWLQLKTSASIGINTGGLVYEKILHKPYRFFLDNNSSHIVGNLNHDLKNAFGTLQAVLNLIANSFIVVSIALGLLLYNYIAATILFFSCSLGYILVTLWTRQRLNRNGIIQSKSFQNIMKILHESFTSIRYVILSNDYNVFTREYKKKYHQYQMAGIRSLLLQQFPRFFMESMGILALCFFVIIYSLADKKNFVTLLGFIALSAHRLLPAMQQCYSALSSIIVNSFSIQKIVHFLKPDETNDHPQQAQENIDFLRKLSLENIFFRYKEEGWTLHNLSLSIKKNSTVALVGRTGSGKSTLADIISGLIFPKDGQMKVDSKVINNSNLKSWQSKISYIPQHIFMADASIAENIALNTSIHDTDIKLIEYVAQQAQIHDFVMSLPEKYDTVIGERGTRLSGGQIQRIGIARALYRKPEIIIFDEATSALDTVTENQLMDSINKIHNTITLIIITHNLSTIKNADSIFILDKGQIIAKGTYDNLLKNSQAFQNLAVQSTL